MKKGKSIISALMAFTMALLCCSCAGSGTSEQPLQPEEQTEASAQSEAETQTQDDTFVSEAIAANRFDTLAEKYGKAAVKTDNITKDGITISEYYYKDSDIFVYVCEGYVYIDEGDDKIYGFNTNESVPVKTVLAGYDPEEYRETFQVSKIFSFDECEEVTSKKNENGVTVLETVCPKSEYNMSYIEAFNYTVDEVESFRYVYEFDENTKEMLGMRGYFVIGGQDVLFNDLKVITDCEQYVPDEQLRSQVFSDDIRTLTLIAAPGTEDEKTFTQTVGKGCGFDIAAAPIYDQELYTDKECTKPLTNEEIDRTSDITLYLKKAE